LRSSAQNTPGRIPPQGSTLSQTQDQIRESATKSPVKDRAQAVAKSISPDKEESKT